MSILRSSYIELGPCSFPAPADRQCYMHTIKRHSKTPLPPDCTPYGPLIYIALAQLVLSLGEHRVPEAIHVTIDEKLVEPGMSQRRPGPHVDGCFVPTPIKARAVSHGGLWLHCCNDLGNVSEHRRMAVIVAATQPGCRVWEGNFEGEPKSDGDLSHIQDQLDAAPSKVLEANVAYLLSPDCVHESMVFTRPVYRQFLRIAFSVDEGERR